MFRQNDLKKGKQKFTYDRWGWMESRPHKL